MHSGQIATLGCHTGAQRHLTSCRKSCQSWQRLVVRWSLLNTTTLLTTQCVAADKTRQWPQGSEYTTMKRRLWHEAEMLTDELADDEGALSLACHLWLWDLPPYSTHEQSLQRWQPSHHCASRCVPCS